MNGLVRSGANASVLSGADPSCHQARTSPLSLSERSDFSALNLTTNSESYGFSNNKDNGDPLWKKSQSKQKVSISNQRSTQSTVTRCFQQTRMTRVALLDLPAHIKVTLRFGHPQSEMRYNRVRKEAFFAASALFCRVHWEVTANGVPRWQLLILKAGNGQEIVQRITGIEPGAVLLLETSGTTTVQRVLRLLTEIEERGINLTEVSPSYWRTLHNRLVSRKRLPIYTLPRHESYLLTREGRPR